MGAGLQELVGKYHVDTVQLDQEIPDNQFLVIADFFDGVELYCVAMGLLPCDQADILHILFQRGAQPAMMQCLLKWKLLNPENATFRALLELLLRLKKPKVAAEVCQYWAQNVSTHFVKYACRVHAF